MTGRTGRLTIEGDRAVLTFQRRLRFPVDAVWSAITDPAHRNEWMGHTTIDPREGGMIETMPDGPPAPPDMKRMTGRIRVWDPPFVFEHEWHQRVIDDGNENSVVRYELRPDGDGTLLTFTHRGLGIPNAEGFLPGTHAYLDRLEAHLADDPLPGWAERYQEVAQAVTGDEAARRKDADNVTERS
ncbi:SRPBCC family protein [Mycolicibacterium sp. XJ1819]